MSQMSSWAHAHDLMSQRQIMSRWHDLSSWADCRESGPLPTQMWRTIRRPAAARSHWCQPLTAAGAFRSKSAMSHSMHMCSGSDQHILLLASVDDKWVAATTVVEMKQNNRHTYQSTLYSSTEWTIYHHHYHPIFYFLFHLWIQVDAIQTGLWQAIPGSVLQLLTLKEIEERICGKPEISFADLEKCSKEYFGRNGCLNNILSVQFVLSMCFMRHIFENSIMISIQN